MQDEVAKHTKKIYDTMKDTQHGFWDKVKEVTIEIFIIVFAVTLSIWLHSWSDHRHEQKETSEFLKGLKDDLANDVRLLEDSRKTVAHLDSNFRSLLTLDHNIALDTMSAKTISNRLDFELSAMHANIGRYEGFKSSGKIGTIEQDSLKQAILVYYQQTIPGIGDIEGIVNGFQSKLMDMIVDRNDKASLQELVRSFKMQALLQFVTSNLKGEFETYTTAAQQAKKIIAMIDQER